MQVILIEDVPNLGSIGEQVTVRQGYARNLLLPKRLAIPASVKNVKRLEHEKRIANFRLAKAVASIESIAKRLSNTSVTIARKVGEQEKLYGSVTTHDIERALKDEGVEIDRKKIILKDPIKALGVYHVPIRLRGEITAEVKLWVVAE